MASPIIYVFRFISSSSSCGTSINGVLRSFNSGNDWAIQCSMTWNLSHLFHLPRSTCFTPPSSSKSQVGLSSIQGSRFALLASKGHGLLASLVRYLESKLLIFYIRLASTIVNTFGQLLMQIPDLCERVLSWILE